MQEMFSGICNDAWIIEKKISQPFDDTWTKIYLPNSLLFFEFDIILSGRYFNKLINGNEWWSPNCLYSCNDSD